MTGAGLGVGTVGARRPSPIAVGVMVWLASELMFFAGLFASYFTIRASSPLWPPMDVEFPLLRDTLFTLVLIASSFTMQAAASRLEHGHRPVARKLLVLTLVLGIAFMVNQFFEWFTIGFTPSTNAYGSLFFLMTGFHGLHVFIGLLLMVGLLARIVGPGPDPGDGPAITVVTYYWHFVDIVWIALFVTIFVLK